MFRPRLALVLVALAALTPTAIAQASDYSDVLHAYQQHGSVPACKFSTAQLSSALRGVNLYGAQYFADFTAAIQNALSARASGSCLATPVSPTGAGAGAGSSSLGPPPGNVTAPTQAGLPAPILLLAALAAAVGLLAALIGLARLRGWEPGVLPWWRHLWQETGYRAGGVWSEFVDWLRSA